MGRAVHFEIHAADPERAAEFYRAVLEWKVDRWGDQDYWLLTTGPDGTPGINGALTPRRGPAPDPDGPVSGYVVTHQVADVAATVAAAVEHGAVVAVETHQIPGVGTQAYLRDPDGNLSGVHTPS